LIRKKEVKKGQFRNSKYCPFDKDPRKRKNPIFFPGLELEPGPGPFVQPLVGLVGPGLELVPELFVQPLVGLVGLVEPPPFSCNPWQMKKQPTT
jgi:hypothetical protein